MHKIKLILLLILPLSVLGQDLGIIDTKTTKNPAINGTHRISTDGKNLFFRNFFGLSKKVASTDSAVFTGTTVLPSNTTIGNVSATELGYLDGVTSPIQAQLDGKFGLSLNNTATGNNVFTGNNTFFTPIFANTTSTNAFSKITGIWSGGVNNNIASFSLQYETRFGGNSIIRNPLNFDYNGWVGIGITAPTTALDVSGGIKATSSITALNLNSYSTTLLATNVGGNVGIGLGSPTSKLHVAGTGRITGALILDNTVSGLLRADASGNITSDATAYLSSSTAASTYAPITSPTFITDATTPRLKITGAGDIGKGSDLVMAGNSNDLTMHGTGKVILGTGGFQRLVVTNAGNVGVGTTAPVAKFEVSGLAGFRYNDGKQADGKYLRSNSTGVAAWDSVKVSEVFGLNTTYLPINNPTATGTLTAPTIANSLGANFATTSGNVGVGTASPTSKIHVIRTGVGIQDLLTLDNLNQSVGVLDGVRLNLRGFNIEASSTYGSSDNILNLGFSTSKQITLLQNGNVGIGTASPFTKLSISGAVGINTVAQSLILNNSTGVYSTYQYNGTSVGDIGTGNQALSGGGTNDFAFTSRTGNLAFGTGSVEKMRIFNNGRVGIGTTTDAGYLLDVNGTARFSNNVSIGTVNNARTLTVATTTNDVNLESINSRTTGNNYALTGNSNGIGAGLNMGGFFQASGATSNHGLRIYNVAATANNYSLYSDSPAQSYFQGSVGIGTTAPTEKLEVFNGNYTNLKISANQQSSIKLNMTTLYGVNNPNVELYNNYGNVGLTLYPTPTATRNDIIYYDNTDKETQFQTDGSTKLRIRGNGNVLIGTTTDAGYKLDVNGNARFSNSSSTGGIEIGQTGFTAKLQYNTNGNLDITPRSGYNTIFTAGNVGIGTTTPTSKLHIEGDNSSTTDETVLTLRGNGENGKRIDFKNAFGSLARITGTKLAAGVSADEGILTFETSTNSILSEKMRITDLGNVGIGTTTPTVPLHVQKGAAGSVVASFLNINQFGLKIIAQTGGSGSNTSITNAGGESISIDPNNAESTRFFANGRVGIGTGGVDAGYKLDVNGTLRTVNDAYFATTSGNVGIGTASPTQKLDVNGNIKTFSASGGGAYYSSTTAVDAAARNWVMRGNSIVYGDFDIRQSNAVGGDPIAAGNSRFYINASGNVGIGTTSPASKLHIVGGGSTTSLSNLNTTLTTRIDNANPAISLGFGYTGSDVLFQQSYNNVNNTATNLSLNPFGGNVGIGTTAPAASAILDITSTTKGVLFPRLTTTQITNITSPANGLTVYNTTLSVLCFYDGAASVWKKVSHSNM